MPFRSMEQGINAIQQGNKAEGARLLKVALRSPQIQGSMRAIALLWLAETVNDPQEKMAYYDEALIADPGNQHATERKSRLMAASLPQSTPPPQQQPTYQPPPQQQQTYQPPPAQQPSSQQTQPNYTYRQQTQPNQTFNQPVNQQPTMAIRGQIMPQQQPYMQQQSPQPTAYRTVGVYNGPNGRGTGIFVTQDGIIATTRYITGGEENIMVELEPGKSVPGQVLRAYPEFDLAFIYTGIQVSQLLPTEQSPIIPENAVLMAIAHNGQVMSGQRRSTQSMIRQEWFPTTIAEMADSGGNPIFNDRNMLIGMLTANANRTSPYVYALTIGTIYRYLGHFLQEASRGEPQVYCSHCGHRSRAGAAGAFYCELCGSTFPAAQNIRRYQLPQMAAFYDNHTNPACPNCGSRIGYYQNTCLRCGHLVRR